MKNIARWLLIISILTTTELHGEDGYRLWLRYDPITNDQLRKHYQSVIGHWIVTSESATAEVIKQELRMALPGLLGRDIPETTRIPQKNVLIIGTANALAAIIADHADRVKSLGNEGYMITSIGERRNRRLIVVANTDIGCLYGTFHLLRLIQTEQTLDNVHIESVPKTRVRILNHWDNLDRSVERGYAGFSLWDWHKLPDYVDPRYIDYARANASIGINGAVLTNVNANALILTPQYITKVKALADLFRPYGIRVYLTARFSAPIEIGSLKTADPLDPHVRQWWKDKVKEIYDAIPDFGGFTVKANSEGQPGPQNYQRSHAEGANMLAEALAPYKGIVMWRAFVYDNNIPVDRTKQAYNEFKPLDGQFSSNVMVQVKNGPLDFQPREPFHPLFGAMPNTRLMMEFQITQEYLGFATHLVYLGALYKEVLDADTYTHGAGSTVGKIIDGSLENHSLSGVAGVSNIGTDRNWCGHPFAQANWYAFGRLAWDHTLSATAVAGEWIRMTFGNNPTVVATLTSMMMASREAAVQYMTPLGLHHIMGYSHHYGPGPWVSGKTRVDWTSVYYHKADSLGIGFNRSSSGTNALEQYAPSVRAIYDNVENCPEKYLLWFHHVTWDYKMTSGRTLWEELCYSYHRGADTVAWMQGEWNSVQHFIDKERYNHVKDLLAIQRKEAIWWRDACLAYFQSFSRREIPVDLEKPAHALSYYQSLEFPFAPGIRPRW